MDVQPVFCNKGDFKEAVISLKRIDKSEQVKKQNKELQYIISILDTALDNALQGIVIIDQHGMIKYANDKFLMHWDVNKKQALNKYITTITKEDSLIKILESGEADFSPFITSSGEEYFVSRLPIKKNGEIIGVVAIGLIKGRAGIENLVQKLNLLESKVNFYKKQLQIVSSSRYTLNNIIGKSRKIIESKEMTVKAGKNNYTVLIVGESGTGKELFAHAIHHASSYKYGDFVRVNCAAIPKDLLEAELFGYTKGAFTGASKQGKPGKFELAHDGTIFLDEIEDMPLEMQSKLLRVIQEKEIERIGAIKPIRLNFRLIAATHENLKEMMEEGKFRKDLFFRLNVLKIELPPLREIKEDIPILIESEQKRDSIKITSPTVKLLKSYDYPGNIRELKNILDYAVSSCSDNVIKERDLHSNICNQVINKQNISLDYNLKKVSIEAEKNAIMNALRSTENNKTKAAKILGIHRTILYNKIKKYRLSIYREA
ncbi:MAG: sigma 54-interacting transcriptional regulator [Thermodesulfobacteriota bacterium]|nr:sigma 54-interacting transcriptional regulator [Thermodesulfobacteriota bacterium]